MLCGKPKRNRNFICLYNLHNSSDKICTISELYTQSLPALLHPHASNNKCVCVVLSYFSSREAGLGEWQEFPFTSETKK